MLNFQYSICPIVFYELLGEYLLVEIRIDY